MPNTRRNSRKAAARNWEFLAQLSSSEEEENSGTEELQVVKVTPSKEGTETGTKVLVAVVDREKVEELKKELAAVQSLKEDLLEEARMLRKEVSSQKRKISSLEALLQFIS